jgi:hypothetical protein
LLNSGIRVAKFKLFCAVKAHFKKLAMSSNKVIGAYSFLGEGERRGEGR